MSAGLLALLLLLPSAQEAAVDAAWRESVLTPYRQGLLAEAGRRLQRAGPDAPALDRGWAANMAGNIAFERGDFRAASLHYSRAVALLGPTGVAGDGDLAMARGNLAMAGEREARAAGLADDLAGLRTATWLAGLAALVLVALLGRRS